MFGDSWNIGTLTDGLYDGWNDSIDRYIRAAAEPVAVVMCSDEDGRAIEVRLVEQFQHGRVTAMKPCEPLVPWSYIEEYVPGIRQMVENKRRLAGGGPTG